MRRSRFNALLGVLSFVMILVSTRAAMAEMLTVPTEYATIQAAIDAAVDGDEVRVLPGNYRERINLLGKKIRIYGSIPNPNLNFISQPDGGSGRLVTCTSGEDDDGCGTFAPLLSQSPSPFSFV